VDWLFVPEEIDADIDPMAFNELCSRWREKGYLDGQRCGEHRDALVKGGFARVWLDRSERIRLFANHQGGYRVRCPETDANITRAFADGVSNWRTGGPRELRCTSCGTKHPLESAGLEPPGVFGRAAVVFSAVESLELGPGTAADLNALFGVHREVVKRIG
jgi:hypothetical protein